MRKTTMKRSLVIGAAAMVATAVAVSAIPAQAANAPGWRKVFSKHYGPRSAYSGFSAVVATSAGNAWAIGTEDESGAVSQQAVAAHWNGATWRSVALPAGAAGSVTAADAFSADNVWAATVGSWVLHYNGTKWTARKMASSGEVTGVAVLGPKAVWVFGGGGFIGGVGTWYYNGKTWKQWKNGNAVGLEVGSAVSRTSIWAIGGTQSPYSALDHFNGKTWNLVRAKALSGMTMFTAIKALSNRDVWVAAAGTRGRHLLHYNGTRWTSVKSPAGLDLYDMVPDGHGGLWFTGNALNKHYLVHRSAAGAWTLVKFSGFAQGVTTIPGGRGLWAVGAVSSPKIGASAAIWADGKV